MKVVIWLMGAMASGKSTLSRLLQQSLSGTEQFENLQAEENGKLFAYTKANSVAVLGKQSKDKMSGGVDFVFNQIKIEGLSYTLEKLSKDSSIEFIIIEGSQASNNWYSIISGFYPMIFGVHLELSYEQNIRRLKNRQFANANGRQPENNEELLVECKDSQYTNVLSKNQQYRNLFEKIKNNKNVKALQLDALQTPEQLLEQTIEFITDNL